MANRSARSVCDPTQLSTGNPAMADPVRTRLHAGADRAVDPGADWTERPITRGLGAAPAQARPRQRPPPPARLCLRLRQQTAVRSRTADAAASGEARLPARASARPR